LNLAKYRHIVWDWNGTLLDDVWLAVATMNTLLERRGMPLIDKDEYVRHFDFPVIDFYRHVGFDFDAEPFEVVAIEFIDAFEARRFECRLHPGAVATLDALRARGFAQSVLSATQHDSLRQYVAHFGIQDRFSHIFGLGDHFAHGKTDLAHHWLATSRAAPGEALLIGDTIHDAHVARAIGVDCFLIAHGHQLRDKLEQTGAPVLEGYAGLGLA